MCIQLRFPARKFGNEWVNKTIYFLPQLLDSNVMIRDEFFITFLMHKEIKFIKQTPLEMKSCKRGSLTFVRDT